MKVEELFERTRMRDNTNSWENIILESWDDDYPGISINSDLGVLLYRAKHQHLKEPTKQQQQEFLDKLKKYKHQKMSHDESINLAFSTLHLAKEK